MKNTISLLLFLLLTSMTSQLAAQTKGPDTISSHVYTVHGKVVSHEESLALEGVTVSVKGTNNITGTQSDGTFSILLSNDQQILLFELKDYESLELKPGKNRQLDIVLKRKDNP